MPSPVLPTIAHVLHKLYMAGAEVLAVDLARQLRDRYRFVFFCLDEVGPLGHQLRDEGFTVISLDRRAGLDWRVARRIRRLGRELDIDLLHAHQYAAFFYASLSRGPRGMRHSRPPVLFTEHGRHYPDPRKRRHLVANRVLLSPGDRVTAVGHFVRQALIDNEGIAPDRIEVVPNGIDTQRFSLPDDVQARSKKIRKHLGLTPDAQVVLQVARLHPVKDHVTALRAMAHVVDKQPQAMLLLVGDGDQRPALEQLADSLGLHRHVRFLGVRRDVPTLMGASDVFLLSSLSEGVSVTLLEAMGCQLPIAATNVGGNPEVVEHEKTGLLSDRQDHEALACNLIRLLQDAELRRRMGQAGRQRLLQCFDQQRMHQRYANLYEELVPSSVPA